MRIAETAILRIFLDAGYRRAEVTNLSLSEIDLDNQTIQSVLVVLMIRLMAIPSQKGDQLSAPRFPSRAR